MSRASVYISFEMFFYNILLSEVKEKDQVSWWKDIAQDKLDTIIKILFIIYYHCNVLVSVPTKSFKEGSDEERHTFVTGDVVEVAEGDLANLKGTILSIDGNKITIMPKHDDLKV